MRWILLIALSLLGGYALLQLFSVFPENYVKIYAGTYLLEMSLWTFLALLILSVLVIYTLFWFVGNMLTAGTWFGRWRKRKNHIKAEAALGAGYLFLIKGDWKKAEKKLLTKTKLSGVPYVNYLAAAQAAQEQSQYVRRDEYLLQAYKSAPNERFAIGLAKARLHYLAGQYDQAEETLNDIASEGKKNSQFVAMQLQTFQATKNWNKVHDLLPAARKLQALPETVLNDIDTEAHHALLVSAEDKEQTWKELPKGQQKQAVNLAVYAHDLIARGESASAEKLLRTALKTEYDDSLVHLYGTIVSDKPAKLRRVVEGLLMARPESAELNLAAGRFAAQEKNTELAFKFLERAIELGQLPGAYSLLGELLEAGNESGRALQLYRSGLARLTSREDSKSATALAVVEPKEGQLISASES